MIFLRHLLTVSMLPVVFNVSGSNCFEQINDVDVLEQEDNNVSLMSRFLRKDKIKTATSNILVNPRTSSEDKLYSKTHLFFRTCLRLQIPSSASEHVFNSEPISSFKNIFHLQIRSSQRSLISQWLTYLAQS
jgi:hypothetical protein